MKANFRILIFRVFFCVAVLSIFVRSGVAADSCCQSTICNTNKACKKSCSRSSCPSVSGCLDQVIDKRIIPSNGTCANNCSFGCFTCGTTIFLPRSVGANTARELAGWQPYLYRCYSENYVAWQNTASYTRSFESDRIARSLFCTDCLTFSGSQAKNRNGNEIIADFFGLPQDFRGTLKIKPLIENFIFDLNFYFGLDDWTPGFYLRFHFPITYTRWNLALDDCFVCGNKFRGQSKFPGCYMFSNTPATVPTFGGVDPTCLVDNAINPLQPVNNNCTAQSIREALSGDFTFGDMTERWKFGKFSFIPKDKTGLADIDVIAGFNFIHNEFYHFALFAQLVVPTGNRPKSKFVFEPIIGNGRHIELGGGLSTHFFFYNDCMPEGTSFAFYLEGNVTHFFKNEQRRSFDFTKNGLLSRYMLLKEFDVDNKYIGRMVNAINFATRNCEVHIPVQVDASAKFAFISGGFNFDVGYNIYFRDRERVRIETECPCDIDSRRFGIKGIQGVCCTSYNVIDNNVMPNAGIYNVTEGAVTAVEASSNSSLLSTTQPNATMFKPRKIESAAIPENPQSICLNYNSKQVEMVTPIADITPKNGFSVANTNAKPAIISCKDLNPNSAAQCTMFTHKVFGYIGYSWFNNCYEPFFGVGGEFEFDGKKCPKNALNQWGVWLKGGITF